MKTYFKKTAICGLFATLTTIAPRVYSSDLEPVLGCNNGAAEIVVDTKARTQVQVKIYDRNIIQYLAGPIEGAFNNSTSSWLLLNHNQPSKLESADEMQLGAFSQSGIFRPDQFQTASGSADFGLSFSAYRSGGGLKVIFKMAGGWRCSEGGHFDYQSCSDSGNTWYLEPDRELRNWYFNSCELR